MLVTPTDYEGGTVSGNVEAGACTLYRIRGTINVRATVIGGLAYMAVIVQGATEAVPSMAGPSQITSGDVLWHDLHMVPIDTSRHIEIDVRVKRRLENDVVYFVIAGVAQTITYAGTWRALIRSGG